MLLTPSLYYCFILSTIFTCFFFQHQQNTPQRAVQTTISISQCVLSCIYAWFEGCWPGLLRRAW